MVLNWMVLPLMGVASVAVQASDTPRPLIEQRQLQDAGMFRYWQAKLPLAKGDSVREGYLVDDTLYVTTQAGTLFSLATDTGLLRWGTSVTEADYTIYKPSHIPRADGGGPVIIPTTTDIFIYERFSGDLLRRFARGFAAGSAAVAMDNLLFMGSADGSFYSIMLDLSTGIGPVRRWEVLAGGPVTATPLLYDNETLIFASQGGEVFSCSAMDKTLDWSYRTRGPIVGELVMDESGVYVASMDRTLYKLSLSTGRVLWQALLSRPLTEGPTLAAHTVFQHGLDIGLVAFDAETGKEKWRRRDGHQFVAHHAKADAILTYDGNLLLLSNETGKLRSTIRTSGLAGAAANTRTDALFLLGKDGRILCARVDAVPYLRRQQVNAARNRLHLPPSRGRQSLDGTVSQVKPGSVKSQDPLRSRRDARPSG